MTASEPGGRRILLVEDDSAVRLALSDRLTGEGFDVRLAVNGDQGAEMAASGSHGLLILDVMLPGKTGFEIAREVRSRGLETPILMLTARGEVSDKVIGLEFGADDYLTKPFEFVELLARIRALLRRAERGGGRGVSEAVEFGDVRVDFRKAQVFRGGALVPLSAKELQLLRCFVENSGAVLSRNELLDVVWGYDANMNTRTVDVHVARLRQKLESDPTDPKLIVTVHGLGYRFEA
jgi:two-component system alkaline phosphatase synthesis response regulator PhoP